jgi:hypothetical protein
MNNNLYIKTVVLLKVLDGFITTMNRKHCNKLFSKIMPTQINIFNM